MNPNYFIPSPGTSADIERVFSRGHIILSESLLCAKLAQCSNHPISPLSGLMEPNWTHQRQGCQGCSHSPGIRWRWFRLRDGTRLGQDCRCCGWLVFSILCFVIETREPTAPPANPRSTRLPVADPHTHLLKIYPWVCGYRFLRVGVLVTT